MQAWHRALAVFGLAATLSRPATAQNSGQAGVPAAPGLDDLHAEWLARLEQLPGAPSLARGRLPSGPEELRLGTTIGGIPAPLLRLVRDGGHVQGELMLYWVHSSEWTPQDNPEDAHAYVRRVFHCDTIGRLDDLDICRVRFPRQPPWSAFWARAESLGVWTLAEAPDEPPCSVVVADGVALLVQTRRGRIVRRVAYDNPYACLSAKAKRADSLLTLVLDASAWASDSGRANAPR